MKKYQVHFSDDAINDLHQLKQYLAINFSTNVTNNVITNLMNRFDLLSHYTSMGRPASESTRF